MTDPGLGATLFGLCGAALVGLGLYGMVTGPAPLRRVVAFNLMGGGVFVLFGAIARRGASAGLAADPVPQALTITGIVVAFAATSLAVMIMRRLYDTAGRTTLDATDGEPPTGDRDDSA